MNIISRLKTRFADKLSKYIENHPIENISGSVIGVSQLNNQICVTLESFLVYSCVSNAELPSAEFDANAERVGISTPRDYLIATSLLDSAKRGPDVTLFGTLDALKSEFKFNSFRYLGKRYYFLKN